MIREYESLTPEIRFSEYDGPWEERRGDALFTSSRAKGKAGLPIYSVTLTNGLVPRDSLERRMEGDAADELNLKAVKGDLVYNMMRMWQGAVGLADTECMVSPAYVVLRSKNSTDSLFFSYNFKRARPLYDLWAYSYGLTEDRLRLYYKDFSLISFVVPELKEQQKIASFLSTVDSKLTKLRGKRDLLETYKRGMMQKLFSQDLRFKAEDGSEFPEWKPGKLGDYAKFSKGAGVSRSDISDTGSNLCIRYGELYTDYSEIITTVISKTNIDRDSLILSKAGDVIIPSSGETREDIATASCVMQSGVALGGDLNILRTNFDGRYLAYYLKNYKWRDIAAIAQGSSVVHLYSSQLASLKVEYPVIEEQQKIADCLSAIDKKIDAVAQQIAQMDTFKQGLLQKMFV